MKDFYSLEAQHIYFALCFINECAMHIDTGLNYAVKKRSTREPENNKISFLSGCLAPINNYLKW